MAEDPEHEYIDNHLIDPEKAMAEKNIFVAIERYLVNPSDENEQKMVQLSNKIYEDCLEKSKRIAYDKSKKSIDLVLNSVTEETDEVKKAQEHLRNLLKSSNQQIKNDTNIKELLEGSSGKELKKYILEESEKKIGADEVSKEEQAVFEVQTKEALNITARMIHRKEYDTKDQEEPFLFRVSKNQSDRLDDLVRKSIDQQKPLHVVMYAHGIYMRCDKKSSAKYLSEEEAKFYDMNADIYQLNVIDKAGKHTSDAVLRSCDQMKAKLSNSFNNNETINVDAMKKEFGVDAYQAVKENRNLANELLKRGDRFKIGQKISSGIFAVAVGLAVATMILPPIALWVVAVLAAVAVIGGACALIFNSKAKKCFNQANKHMEKADKSTSQWFVQAQDNRCHSPMAALGGGEQPNSEDAVQTLRAKKQEDESRQRPRVDPLLDDEINPDTQNRNKNTNI